MMTLNKPNKGRIADLHTAMSGYVERGDIAGIVTLIARSDEIHVDAIGMRIRRSVCLRDKDAVKKIPVRRRNSRRISSAQSLSDIDFRVHAYRERFSLYIS